jgi:hypothetical protein
MNKDFTGIFICKEILQTEGLLISEKLVLAVIDNLSNNGNGCYASNGYIAEMVGLAPQRIANMLSVLKSKSLISIEKGGGKNRIISLNNLTVHGNNLTVHGKDITVHGKEDLTVHGKNLTSYGNNLTVHGNNFTPHGKHIVKDIKNTKEIVKSDIAQAPTKLQDLSWMEVAQKMTEYVQADGKAQWDFMCQVTNFRGDALQLFSNWAGKASPYELSRWKEMIPKLQNWMRNHKQTTTETANEFEKPKNSKVWNIM